MERIKKSNYDQDIYNPGNQNDYNDYNDQIVTTKENNNI